jgi:hypothetical protein
MRRRTRAARLVRAASAVVVIASMVASTTVEAAPQGTVGITVGAAGVSPTAAPVDLAGEPSRRYWQGTDLHLGVRGDVLFGRSRNADFGVGPYAELLTQGFTDVQFGGGASVLLPVLSNFPIVLSEGAYARKGSDGAGLTPGVASTLFFGSRSYNFHANYVLSAGLLAEMRYGFGPDRETSILIGAQLDLVALSLPFVLLAGALRGSSPEARPLR